ncbi:phosphoribosylformylglycinamidine cyclo-ligase [Petrotoga mexicana DSM 14811]|uniref:Phosphoribosylformylglycinamidine cyclo-ligase n=1 Tax=Petrotoga mexicana DSM 14811 TaxID=1122954 RepID=A0A2K1PAZ7_9BACT|nr:phosphoribosylformylglycinamidine cyclo-ligase [Petrotoga mexicana]PNR99959.1 phosphoribosylformylglycinamidine cyclo-ligase [Petrotoga mexicana DSM 14811]
MFYKNSGVDIDKANESIKEIRSFIGSNIGAYAGVFPLKDEISNYKNPFLVATSDGIGTKLQLLRKYERWDIAAQDLVAMNLNDLVCMGAKPLFFLDYFSTSNLNKNHFVTFIRHLKNILDEYECVLLGGETAELPGVFRNESEDIAGFAVGIVEKDHIFDYSKIVSGDKLIGLSSSGIHSNGYSLVRKLLDERKIPFTEELLNPTRIYVKQTLTLLNYIKGAAHITGGGIIDNLPRIIPDGFCAEIKVNWETPSIFESIKQSGVSDEEMFKTFNMGIGMIYVVPENNFSEITKIFESVLREDFFIIGEVKSANDSNQKVKIIR